MKDYTVITGNNNGQPFPDTRAINSTGPLATDGTEVIDEVVNDLWAEKQAFLDSWGETPNGFEDEAGIDPVNFLPKSQPLAIQYMNFGTPGVVVPWMSPDDPAIVSAAVGFDIRILLLQGQGIDRTVDEYKRLDLMCYVGDVNNPTADSFCRADDAAGTIRNIAGQYLILPDMRGQFLRGLDEGAGIDPDGVGRISGSLQLDALQDLVGQFDSHRDEFGNSIAGILATGVFINLGQVSPILTGAVDILGTSDAPRYLIDFKFSNDPAARTSTETRAVNMAVRFGVYY